MRTLLAVLILCGTLHGGEYPSIVPDWDSLFVFAVQEPEPAGPVYNTVWVGPTWTHPGRGKAAVISHLMSGQHRGKFDRERLSAMSLAELERLHSNDHEGRPYAIKNVIKKTAGPDCPT